MGVFHLYLMFRRRAARLHREFRQLTRARKHFDDVSDTCELGSYPVKPDTPAGHGTLASLGGEPGLLALTLGPRRHQIDEVGGGFAERSRGEARRDLPEGIALVANDGEKLEDVGALNRHLIECGAARRRRGHEHLAASIERLRRAREVGEKRRMHRTGRRVTLAASARPKLVELFLELRALGLELTHVERLRFALDRVHVPEKLVDL